MKKLLFIVVTVLLVQGINAQTDSLYFGKTPPGDTPVKFAPVIITGFKHSPIAISPHGDEIFWVETEFTERIKFTRYENGAWTNPTYADFVKDYLSYHHSGTVFSPNGDRLYFISNRPGGLGDFDLWYVEKDETGWGGAVNAGEPYNTTGREISPAFTNTGKAYRLGYTNSPASFTYSSGLFSSPVSINNHPVSDWYSSVYISPDEEYVIFAGDDTPNLYIRFKNNKNEWGNPINLGNKINTNEPERFPVVSPDGKYLFFLRDEEYINNYYWVSTSIIDSLRSQITSVGRNEDIIPREIKLNQNYPNPFNPTTVISYQLSAISNVNLKIYDVIGREVANLINEQQDPGFYQRTFDARRYASGMYIYRLIAKDEQDKHHTFVKKMMMVK